jgi:hypothetical protein
MSFSNRTQYPVGQGQYGLTRSASDGDLATVREFALFQQSLQRSGSTASVSSANSLVAPYARSNAYNTRWSGGNLSQARDSGLFNPEWQNPWPSPWSPHTPTTGSQRSSVESVYNSGAVYPPPRYEPHGSPPPGYQLVAPVVTMSTLPHYPQPFYAPVWKFFTDCLSRPNLFSR